MKIVFWSVFPGHGSCTSNMLVTSLYAAMKYDITSLLMQTHYRNNNLEGPIMGVTPSQTDVFSEVGIDALTRNIKSAELTTDDFINCSISVVLNKLHLITGTTKQSEEFFQYDIDKTFNNILHYANSSFDLVFVDTQAGDNSWLFSQLENENIDLLVVNLPQNKFILDQFFKALNPLLAKDNVFFLFGNCDNNSSQTVSNLLKRYKQLDITNTAGIPHNTDFMDAMSSGRLLDFMRQNIKCEKEDENYLFMKQLSETTAKILKKVGIKGEIEDDNI